MKRRNIKYTISSLLEFLRRHNDGTIDSWHGSKRGKILARGIEIDFDILRICKTVIVDCNLYTGILDIF